MEHSFPKFHHWNMIRSTFCMRTQIELQTQQFCAQALKKISYKSGPPFFRNYSLFTNFISKEALVHKTFIIYEIAIGSDNGLNLETIFQVYTFLVHPVDLLKREVSLGPSLLTLFLFFFSVCVGGLSASFQQGMGGFVQSLRRGELYRRASTVVSVSLAWLCSYTQRIGFINNDLWQKDKSSSRRAFCVKDTS